MAIDLDSDSIWEAVRLHLHTQLSATLSLKSFEQGSYFHIPPGDDLGALLPLCAIEWVSAEGRHLPGFSAIELIHRVRIHYLCLLADTDVATRKVAQALETIANTLCQPPYEGATALPGYTPGDRVNVFAKGAPTMRVEDTFTEMELPIGHGHVEIPVTIHYYND